LIALARGGVQLRTARLDALAVFCRERRRAGRSQFKGVPAQRDGRQCVILCLGELLQTGANQIAPWSDKVRPDIDGNGIGHKDSP